MIHVLSDDHISSVQGALCWYAPHSHFAL